MHIILLIEALMALLSFKNLNRCRHTPLHNPKYPIAIIPPMTENEMSESEDYCRIKKFTEDYFENNPNFRNLEAAKKYFNE